MHIHGKIIAKVVMLTALMVFLSSCASIHPIGLQPITGRVPDASTEELLSGILLSGTRGLRSEVAAVLSGPDGERLGKFSGALLMIPPRAIRLVLYDVFGARVFDISLTESGTIAYVPSDGIAYEGEMPLPWPSGGGLTHVRDEYGRHVLIESIPDRTPPASRMFIFNERLENVATVIYASGAPVLEAYYYDFESDVPMAMDFMLNGLYTFHIRLKEPEVGIDLPEGAFNNLPADTGDLKFMPLPTQEAR